LRDAAAATRQQSNHGNFPSPKGARVFRTIGLLISLPCVALSVLPAYAQDRSVAMVLDASGSMKAALPDRTTRTQPGPP
jgi:hypothetical protein